MAKARRRLINGRASLPLEALILLLLLGVGIQIGSAKVRGKSRLDDLIAFSAVVNETEWEADILTIKPDGTGLTQLTDIRTFGPLAEGLVRSNRFPVWSPDREWIAFVHMVISSELIAEKRRYTIYKMRADGSKLRPILKSRNIIGSLSWSPDGASLLFDEVGGPAGHGLHILNLKTERRKSFPGVPNSAQSTPAWSPDGRKIAFSAKGKGEEGFQLYIMNADGRRLKSILSMPVHLEDAAWSPDGRKLAFTRVESSNLSSIWTANIDGSDPQEVVPAGNEPGQPAWSPDGRQILFSAGEFKTSNLFIVNADGTKLRQITPDIPRTQDPAW